MSFGFLRQRGAPLQVEMDPAKQTQAKAICWPIVDSPMVELRSERH